MRSLIWVLVFSVVAAAGSLYLSLGMGLSACALCFYQRTFAFALVVVLAIGILTLGDHRERLIVLCLPLAVGGFGVAGFHTYLVVAGKLECPTGIAGLGPAPAQSLAVYSIILVALLYGFLSDIRANGFAPLGLALGLGAALVYGSIVANPPPKVAEKPTEPGEQLKMCRVPYSGE
jgi:disulfide bond formation protein DsbB